MKKRKAISKLASTRSRRSRAVQPLHSPSARGRHNIPGCFPFKTILTPFSSVKNKATVCFERFWSGEVIEEIIDDAGDVVEVRNLGPMTEEEFCSVLKLIRKENPYLAAYEPIKLTWN